MISLCEITTRTLYQVNRISTKQILNRYLSLSSAIEDKAIDAKMCDTLKRRGEINLHIPIGDS